MNDASLSGRRSICGSSPRPRCCCSRGCGGSGGALSDLRRLRDRRSLPIRERFAIGGELWSWLFIILALASLAIALARPRGVTTVVNRAGVDIVVLQDGSASMHVKDVSGNRWHDR